MGTITSDDVTSGMTERNIQLSEADFREHPAHGGAGGHDVPAGEIEEVGRAEVGDDGQLVSYELIQPGQELGETGLSAKGKAFMELVDSDGNPLPGSTEVRLVGRPQNADRRDELSGWKKYRDLNVEDPDKRLEWPPARGRTDGGEVVDKYVRHGRLVGIEVRHPSEDINVDLEASDIAIPARAWY